MEEENKEYDKNGYPYYKNSLTHCHRRSIMKKHDLKEIPNGWEVHHLDGNKNNYSQSNLILLREQDHKDLEKYIRILKNLNIAYFFLVGVAFPLYLISYLRLYGELWAHIYFILATSLLFLAFILRAIPSWRLRRALFMFGLIKRHK